MKKLFCVLLAIVFSLSVQISVAEGLLPSLTETVGIAMPSLGEALGRYPDNETENGDGSITEHYTNVSEADFNVFSVYLQQQEAELADYKAEKGVLSAEIRVKGASFSLNYDSKSGEATVTYPSGTFDEWVENAKTHFDTAQKLLAEGKTKEAYAEIFAIPLFMKYGPVDYLMKEDENLSAAMVAHEAKCVPYREVGNVVTFGTYPQTKEGTDQTPIEWIVLDYDEINQKALLISKYGLDVVPYNKTCTDITWEQCTLRVWLNGEFLSKAFSKEERSAIMITNVDNSSDQGWSELNTDSGNNTQDKIFLLSYAEAKRYRYVENNDINVQKSRVAPTAYAIAQGAKTEGIYQTADGKPAGVWWLRSPGYRQNNVYSVFDSSIGYFDNVDLDCNIVRPALWLNLESDFF